MFRRETDTARAVQGSIERPQLWSSDWEENGRPDPWGFCGLVDSGVVWVG